MINRIVVGNVAYKESCTQCIRLPHLWGLVWERWLLGSLANSFAEVIFQTRTDTSLERMTLANASRSDL